MPAELDTQEQEIDSQDLTDNSDAQTVEPSTEDNSNTVETKEPEQNNDDNKTDTNTGFTDLDTANKSYQELQKKLGEQGLELGDLRKKSDELTELKEKQSKFLQKLGFNSLEEYENKQRKLQYDEDVSKFEANRYLDYINEAEFPDEVKKLITLYHSSTGEDKRQVLDSIEANFSTEIIKRVAADVAMYRGQLDGEKRQALEEQQYNTAISYLVNASQKYQDEFNDKNFLKLYGDAFSIYGTGLDTDYVVNFYHDLVKSIEADVVKKHNIHIENENTKDRISDGVNSRSVSDTKDILDMSEDEIRQELKKYK